MTDFSKCPRCGYRLNTKQRKELRQDYPNAFQPWTPTEDRKLQLLVETRSPLLDIAEELGRQPRAILKRSELLGLMLAAPETSRTAPEPVKVPMNVDSIKDGE